MNECDTAEPRLLELPDVLKVVGDRLTVLSGHYYVTATRCECGEDDGIRYEDDYRSRLPYWDCQFCGDSVPW